MYADDLAFVSSDATQLRNALHILNTWAANNNMKVNASKSGIVLYEFDNPIDRDSIKDLTDFPIV